MREYRITTFLFVLFIAGSIFPPRAYCYRFGEVELKPHTSIYESYDDNITYAETNVKRDASTNLNFGMDLAYESPRSTLGLSGNVTRQQFDTYTNFNNTNEDVNGTFNHEFTQHSRVSLRDSFVHAEEPRSFEDEFGRTTGRYSYGTNN